MIELELRGGTYHLYLNGTALFDIYGKFGQVRNLLDLVEPFTREGYEATIWILCELSTQGELYRRLQGYEKAEPLNYLKTLTQVQPYEIPGIKAAVIEALREGFIREHASAEAYDPWLDEIEESSGAKKTNHFSGVFASAYGGPGLVCFRGNEPPSRSGHGPNRAGKTSRKGESINGKKHNRQHRGHR